MGVGRILRGLFDEKFLISEILRIQEETYHKIKMQVPGLDEHEYLARVWLSRKQAGGTNPYVPKSQTDAWADTFMFACADPQYAIKALAIRILMDEVPPQVLAKYPSVMADYEYMMAPVLATRDEGEAALTRLYAERNPMLAARMNR